MHQRGQAIAQPKKEADQVKMEEKLLAKAAMITLLKKTGNVLVVAYEEKTTDDLYIGPFVLHSRSVAALQW